jgi:hypothetical protein
VLDSSFECDDAKSMNQITSLYLRKTLVSGLHNSNSDIKNSGCCPQKEIFLICC